MMRSTSSVSAGASPRRRRSRRGGGRRRPARRASGRRSWPGAPQGLAHQRPACSCREPSIVPHIEPEPSRTMITEAGSAACAVPSAPRAWPAAPPGGQRHARRLTLADSASHPLIPMLRVAPWRHCTRERVGLARALRTVSSLRVLRVRPMGQETLDLLLKRRSAKAAMLAEPGPTPAAARHHPDRRRPRARPQEAGALALHRLRGRGARQLRPHPAQGVPGRGEGDALGRPPGDRAHPPAARADRDRRDLPRDAQSRGARVGAGPLLRRGLLQSVSRRQRAGLRHLLDHRVVFLQPAPCAPASSSPPTSAWPASSTSAPPRSSSPTASGRSLPRSSPAGSGEPTRKADHRQSSFRPDFGPRPALPHNRATSQLDPTSTLRRCRPAGRTFGQTATIHAENAIGEALCQLRLVQGADDGHSRRARLFVQQFQDCQRRFGVQAGDRLIGQDDEALLRNGARDRHALLLAT